MADEQRSSANDTEAVAEARQRLAQEVAAEFRDTARQLGTDTLHPELRAALARVPRHRFVPGASIAEAYANRPLPIGHGQTISQPYIVAAMTQLARPGPDDRVLEIGTGCGYQAAVLAELAGQVISIEAVPDLAESARARLAELGYGNVTVIAGDGSRGHPEQAPYDVILVTAAAPDTATQERLAQQLAPGGRLVIPVETGGGLGRHLGLGGHQVLRLIEADRTGQTHTRDVLPVAFVPLVSKG
jgi:protein-L-isoaspartate(D-aspartate) O-methyltransferase